MDDIEDIGAYDKFPNDILEENFNPMKAQEINYLRAHWTNILRRSMSKSVIILDIPVSLEDKDPIEIRNVLDELFDRFPNCSFWAYGNYSSHHYAYTQIQKGDNIYSHINYKIIINDTRV